MQATAAFSPANEQCTIFPLSTVASNSAEASENNNEQQSTTLAFEAVCHRYGDEHEAGISKRIQRILKISVVV